MRRYVMRRSAYLLIVLLAAALVGGCVQEKYEEGRSKQTDKADKMIEQQSSSD